MLTADWPLSFLSFYLPVCLPVSLACSFSLSLSLSVAFFVGFSFLLLALTCSSFSFLLHSYNKLIEKNFILQPQRQLILVSRIVSTHTAWADTGDLVGLRLLACWDCGFESCRRHRRLSLVSVVCCEVEVSASG